MKNVRTFALSAVSIYALMSTAVQAQETDPGAVTAEPAASEAAPSRGITEIVVTAQKRAESVNEVPLSITAIDGETLAARGITDVRSLEKAVPGFQYIEGSFAAPVYAIRGIGFNDSTLGSRATVSVYVDEVPLPFSIVTKGAALDLERVEVLKGPQGTLFGQNATGGAINYIAAKPTSEFQAGLNFEVGSFQRVDVSGFVSGPITDTLTARLSARNEAGKGWQKSLTRPGDRLGAPLFSQGRLLLDWEPSDRLSVNLNFNGFIDRSETQAPQYIAYDPLTPAFAGLGIRSSSTGKPTGEERQPFRRLDDRSGLQSRQQDGAGFGQGRL